MFWDKFLLETRRSKLCIHKFSQVCANLRLSRTVFQVVAEVAVDHPLELLPFLKQLSGLVLEVIKLFLRIVAG